jgi:hypothetical protein
MRFSQPDDGDRFGSKFERHFVIIDLQPLKSLLTLTHQVFTEKKEVLTRLLDSVNGFQSKES